MKTTFILIAFFSIAFLNTAAEADREGSQSAGIADVKADRDATNAENMFPLAEEVSGAKLIQKRDDYLRERNWVIGYSRSNPNSAYLGWGQATIQSKPDDVKFGQSRVLAFESALMEAQGDFVRFQQRMTTTETLRSFFQDSAELSEEDTAKESNRLKVIAQKVLALADAELDQSLEKAGVDIAQFRSQPIESKRKLLQDSISRSIRVRALESVTGVRVLATFEDLNAVGVMIVYSDNQREMAKSILVGRTVPRSSGGHQKEEILKQIEASCPNGEKDLADVFGVRVMADENGDRVLVSFGQWSPAVTRADSRFRRDTTIKASRVLAMNLADGALTDFVNSTLSLESESAIWQDAGLNRITRPDGVEEVESLTIGETLRSVLKQHGNATLQGVATIKEWTANHPETGHLLVGHVLMWSPTSRDAAIHGLNSRVPGERRKTQNKYDGKVRVSPDFDKDADF